MSPEQRKAVIAFITRQIDEAAFLPAYGIEKANMASEVAAQLWKAMNEKDGDLLFLVGALQAAFQLPADPKHPDNPISLYHALLVQDWHEKHEDIIGYLQQEKSPESVNVLKEAILLKPKLAYLAYDDYGAFYKKCLWALQAIGTPQAISIIRECAESDIPELKREAEYRLSRTHENAS